MTTTSSSSRPLAVVTGASSGIGFELAKQFATHDYDLIVAAEDDELYRAARVLESLGAHVEAVQVDLATDDGVDELHRRMTASGRPVDALALNAGVGAERLQVAHHGGAEEAGAARHDDGAAAPERARRVSHARPSARHGRRACPRAS